MRALMKLREAENGEGTEEYTFLNHCRTNASISRAQIFQDLFVLFETRQKRAGFFVEFGAGDGFHLSNTHLLEKEMGWSGILAEPARVWHDDLTRGRGCAIDFRCVWKQSGDSLEFCEAESPEYSTIAQCAPDDMHASYRQRGRRYAVETVTLDNLLTDHHAPRSIDYLSIDTEGSEWEILLAFDFRKYDIRLITVEHNYRPDRQRLHELLQAHGYIRKFENVSLVDDWYVRR